MPNTIKERLSLSGRTSFKIGGPAEFFIEPVDEYHLSVLLRQFRSSGIPVRVIGAGSNILAGDGLLKGVVLSLRSAGFSRLVLSGNRVRAGAGVLLSRLICASSAAALSGVEFLTGIPGSVGGAVMMNAGIRDGASWRSIADVIEKVRVMDYNGRVAVLSRRSIAFSYRRSGLEKYIILGVQLRLAHCASSSIVKSRILAYGRRRRQSQDYRYPCAGCIFKNPPGDSAGRLIELCGLKGAGVGQAVVSKVHANFIVNTGNARARDVLRLMQKVRREVKKRFNVLLDTEVKVWR